MSSKESDLPKYVFVQHIKGRTYYRFRRNKLTRRLMGEPGTAEFDQNYKALLDTSLDEPKDRPFYRAPIGSFALVIREYENSPEFKQLKPGTQRDYSRYLSKLEAAAGFKLMKEMPRRTIFLIRDKLAGTPAAANHMLAVMRTLYNFAIQREYCDINPTDRVGKLRARNRPYRRWSEGDIAVFRAKAHPMMRLAMEIGLYTGQRVGDVIRMTWADYDGRQIRVRQQKTGSLLYLPVHHALKSILDQTDKVGFHILTTKTGRPFHDRVFSRYFMLARNGAGLSDEYSFHGLRHTAASNLAEVGCSSSEIQAITGHKSLKLLERYISQASQETQAEAAIVKLSTYRKPQ